jgi:hypothetical protein
MIDPKDDIEDLEAEAAALDFEPWEGEFNVDQLPNNKQFTEDGLEHLITCRLALAVMYTTRAGLGEMEGDLMVDLLDRIGTASNFFTGFSDLLEGARARLRVAGASASKGQRGRDWGSA